MRGHRLFVGSLASMFWPAMVLVLPVGITFAAARVYAEAAPAPPSCEAGIVVECADAEAGAGCGACAAPPCACTSDLCTGGAGPVLHHDTLVCKSYPSCESFEPAVAPCAGKAENADCTTSAGTAGKCATAAPTCVPADGGAITSRPLLGCRELTGTSSSSTSSSGTYVPGPDKVPGSSSSSGSSDDSDSGCAASPATTGLPLAGAPLGLGLLYLLRRRQPRKAPSERKRS